ncbi:MAG: hypothetical protein IJC42_04445, partial [Oscillospiraceae bacterium]|nr:hypothetical protein [Oscillospiraceae bacterium]
MDILTKIKPVPQKTRQGNGRVLLGKSGRPSFCIVSDNCNGFLAKNALLKLEKKLIAAIGGKNGEGEKT